MQWAAFRSSRKRIELGKFNIIQFLVEVSSIRINTQGDRSHSGGFFSGKFSLKGDLHGLVGTGGYTEFTGNALIVVKGDPHLFSCNRKCSSGTDRGASGALDASILVPLDILGKWFDIQAQTSSKL
jgi:hypothetical protein